MARKTCIDKKIKSVSKGVTAAQKEELGAHFELLSNLETRV